MIPVQSVKSLSLISTRPFALSGAGIGTRFDFSGMDHIASFTRKVLARANPIRLTSESDTVQFFLRNMDKQNPLRTLIEKSVVHHHWHTERQTKEQSFIIEKEPAAPISDTVLKVRDLLRLQADAEVGSDMMPQPKVHGRRVEFEHRHRESLNGTDSTRPKLKKEDHDAKMVESSKEKNTRVGILPIQHKSVSSFNKETRPENHLKNTRQKQFSYLANVPLRQIDKKIEKNAHNVRDVEKIKTYHLHNRVQKAIKNMQVKNAIPKVQTEHLKTQLLKHLTIEAEAQKSGVEPVDIIYKKDQLSTVDQSNSNVKGSSRKTGEILKDTIPESTSVSTDVEVIANNELQNVMQQAKDGMIDIISRKVMERVESMWEREIMRRGGSYGI